MIQDSSKLNSTNQKKTYQEIGDLGSIKEDSPNYQGGFENSSTSMKETIGPTRAKQVANKDISVQMFKEKPARPVPLTSHMPHRPFSISPQNRSAVVPPFANNIRNLKHSKLFI